MATEQREPEPDELRDLALIAGQAGAQAILRQRREGLTVDTKAHATDFVTSADLAADRAIAGVLTAARPRDGVVSEESPERPGESGLRWFVDPVDGTASFYYGRGDYAVSIGVEREHRIIAGAVVCPATGAWAAAGTDILARDLAQDPAPGLVERPTEASVVSIGYPTVDGPARARLHGLIGDRLLGRYADFRRIGSSAVDLMAVALGQQQGYLGFGVEGYDIAGGEALVHAVGGATTWITTKSGLRAYAAGTAAVVDDLAAMAKEV